ncbi:uncharacterized protein CANTADRAFT_69893 [Suhomyces tanzawaensis NRRL Y-17324]|uniref:Uncharacterized protein n=1 Tax=Suhomyces tanzawaensis NRRL Y-17324 TaxID=984487 RepID=A0A1E4SFC0_9ASCO|nr:uncharacterized protein CANTADRAFT_69893 [Suhomyces tanzawaensis NRRL Y-17324]ODV78193.1 hypothetical protein CANTADRAFT_69893 [Suhomyces tanzawaensis NRRL Y-17324]
MRRKGPSEHEVNVAKLKRIVRPLISKIHVLNGLNVKYPDILEFKFPHEPYHQVSTNDNNVNLPPTKKQKTGYENEADISYTEPDFGQLPKEDPASIPHSFINPEDSKARLESLKPYISLQIYQAYREIFQIFQNIIHTTTNAYPCSIPKLSTLSSFKMGKFMALSTKSTFYKSNQASLFDQDALPSILKQSQTNLSDDIDHWFELEPKLITNSYRIYFFFGYLIHLLTFHLNQILFLLIPVLVHWLEEESKQGKEILRIISRSLFSEFWLYDSKYGESIDRMIIHALNGNIENVHNTKIFWILHDIGYWKSFIGPDNYDNYFLNSLSLNNKLNHVPKHLIPDIYSVIRRNPQHPKNNLILAITITNLIASTRSLLKSSTTTIEIMEHLNDCYDQMQQLITSWLFFLPDYPLVYNSLYPGNEVIFEALLKISNFLEMKVLRVIDHLQDHRDMEERKYQFEEFLIRNGTFYHLMTILRAYFLDTGETLDLGSYTPEEISSLLIDMQVAPSKLIPNTELDDFLVWLYHTGDTKLFDLGQLCFEKYYGAYRGTRLGTVKDLYR